MAKVDFKGIDEYKKQLAELGKSSEGICKFSIYEAAGMVLEAVKANTPRDSGDLQNCISLAPMRNDNGYINTKIEWAGYDSKGTPNAIKAAVLERGRSNKNKVPFIRPAVNSVKKSAENAIEAALEKKLKQIMK
jgi:phage protein, HK97 gp10 family